MLEVVSDSFDLSSQINVTLEEKMRVAKTWARVLFGIIPEERLPEAFDQCVQTHKSTYPVNAYDLKAKWEEISLREREQFAEFQAAEKQKNVAENCPMSVYHDEDTLVEYQRETGSPEKIKLPCHQCRGEAHELRRIEFVAKENLKAKVSKIELESVSAKHLSARQIIDNAIQIISAERRAAKSEHEAESAFQAWSLAVRVKARIVEGENS